jgi:hypothetical protein
MARYHQPRSVESLASSAREDPKVRIGKRRGRLLQLLPPTDLEVFCEAAIAFLLGAVVGTAGLFFWLSVHGS